MELKCMYKETHSLGKLFLLSDKDNKMNSVPFELMHDLVKHGHTADKYSGTGFGTS